MLRSKGAPVPDVTLRDLEGADEPLSVTFSPKGALLVIGHRDCKTTRQVLPYVDRIHRRRGRKGRVLAVLQDSAETARALARELSLDLPLRLEDDPYPLAEGLGLTTVPTLLLVDGSGRILQTSEGFRREDLEGFARALGVDGPLFVPRDDAPALRPG
jgi:hypothetical protein